MMIKLISVLAVAFAFATIANGLDVRCNYGMTIQYDETTCHVKNLSIHEPTTLNFIDSQSWDYTNDFEFAYRNNITVMPTGIFQRFQKLTRFSLTDTDLKSIRREDFENADALTNLKLSENKLQVLPSAVFSKAPKVTELYLGNNELTTIEDFAFSGLYQLCKLFLDDNRLTILKRDTFAGAPIIDMLRLDANQIDTIEDGAFDLPKLGYLFLRRNKIRTLSDNVFTGAPSLHSLSIYKNNLTHIGQSIYKCEKLQYLDLEANQIDDIDLHSFAIMANLEYLTLKNSGLRFQENIAVTPGSVAPSKVFDLDLSENELTNSDVLLRLESLGFVNLRTLDLRNNNFTTIDGLRVVKQKFPHIEHLKLSGNSFDYNWIMDAVERLTTLQNIIVT